MSNTSDIRVSNDGGQKEKKAISASDFVRSLTVTRGDGDETIVNVAQRLVGEEGVIVWDAALVLAYFLERYQKLFRLHEGVHVVELGAGTGAVGLVAAALGATCTLTDLDRIVPLLDDSIALNESLKDRLSAKPLHWGDQEQIKWFETYHPDLIVVADCVYYAASLEPLIVTLASLSKLKSCPVLLCYEVRDDFDDKRDVKDRFFELAKKFFRVHEFQTEDCHQDYAADDIKVFRFDPI